jgi:hypothetical protein
MEDNVLFAVSCLGSVAHYSGSAIQGPLSDSSHIVLTGWVSNGKFGHDPQARFSSETHNSFQKNKLHHLLTRTTQTLNVTLPVITICKGRRGRGAFFIHHLTHPSIHLSHHPSMDGII